MEEAQKILEKKDLTVDDYNRFIKIGKELKDEIDIYMYSWLSEGFQLRLPEIAVKTGSYDFINE